MSWSRGLAYGALLSAWSCASDPESPALSSQHVRLPAGQAAAVGSEQVAALTVARIAAAQQVPLTVARERAVNDARFAVGGRAAFQGGSIVPVLERAAWARALLETFEAEARAGGPASDGELADLSALRWQDFDRPETVRTTHAVARVERPESQANAQAIAERIAQAVHGVTDPAEFIRLAQAVPHEGVDVRVERLPAVTRDGRTYYPENPPRAGANEHFDLRFAEAAHSLAVGQISEPVRSSFGYHVILCEARLPGLVMPLEQRRTVLAEEVMKRRAEQAKQELLARLSAAQPIVISRAVDDLTARVQVTE